MERTLEQVLNEAWKTPLYQTRRDLKELREKMGEEAYWHEYQRVAWKNSEYRMTSPDPFMPPKPKDEG